MIGRSARRAVIDIGSNSVRLVIYEGPPRAPIAVFNEKSLCGLGDRVPDTGALRESAMADALRVLRRFAAVLADDEVDTLRVFATAASREAPNGPAFLDEIKRIGFHPVLLTGEEEARYAAFGVLSGAPEVLNSAHGGLAGDMGGGSLELSLLSPDASDGIADLVSLPLGGLRLSTLYEGDMAAAKKAVNVALAEVPWLEGCAPDTFYVVGGAWRALGRMAIANANHPISILDHYALPKDRIIQLCRLVEKQSAETLAGTPGVQSRRAPTLPFAAMVLRKVVALTGAVRVAISSSGVREGLLFEELSPARRSEDPLLPLCRHYADRLSPGAPARRAATFDFLSPAHEGEPSARTRLRRAAAELANLAELFHPDTRAVQAGTTVINMPFLSLSHEERVSLAAILYQRHCSSEASFPSDLHTELVSEEQRQWCRQVGLGLRFATDLDPIGRNVLPTARLERGKGALTLYLPEEAFDHLSEAPLRRFERFAGSFGLAGVVKEG